MPRTKKAAAVATPVAEAAPEAAPAITLAVDQAPASDAGGRQPAEESPRGFAARTPRQPARQAAAGEPAPLPETEQKIVVSLSDIQGGPEMQLLRNFRYKQMQIRFERGQPDEKYLEKLKAAGWTDRTQEEGVFTKQIDKNARWQSVDKMEKEFKAVANEIRKDKGLGPVLEGLGA